MFTLYDYQKDAVAAAIMNLENQEEKDIIVAPTGAGKSVIIAEICRRLRIEYKANICVLTHREAIIMQNMKIASEQIIENEIGIYSASLNRRDILPITFASISSIYNKNIFNNFKYFIIDECHLVPEHKDSMYQLFFKNKKAKKIIGLTATPYRGSDLMSGADKFFSNIIYEIDFIKLQNEKKLCTLLSKSSEHKLQTNGIKKTGDDFNTKELAQKFNKSEITKKILQEVISIYKNKRKSWLVFCIDIAHAENVNNYLCENNIKSTIVHSKRNKVENRQNIESFKRGEYKALVSVAVLTTGFDAPNVDLLVLLRPTESITLHIQMIGRGARISNDKKDCIVLDYAGNIDRLGPINMPYMEFIKVKKDKKNNPMKICINCNSYIPRHTKMCVYCNFKYRDSIEENNHHKLNLKASTSQVVNQVFTNRNMIKVDAIKYYVAKGRKGIPMFHIQYTCFNRRFIDYLCFNHNGLTKYKAQSIWKSITNHPTNIPNDSYEAIKLINELKQIHSIEIKKNGRYFDIIRRIT